MTLTSQQQAIQNKIDALDSATTSTATLLSLLTQALDEGNIIWSYDSAGQIPKDSAFHGMIHWKADSDTMGFLGTSNTIHLIDSQDTAPVILTGQAFIEGYNIQGDTYGYRYGGTGDASRQYETDRFNFASDGNAAGVSGLSGSPSGLNQGSRTSYTSHQYLGISSSFHFPFANEDGWTANSVTNAPTGYSYFGHKQASATHVYRLGGSSPLNVNVVDKFPVAAIASGAQAVDVGNLSVNMGYSMGGEGASSETHCYRVGGFKVPGYNAGPIQKVAYASDGDATQPGNPTSGGYNLRQNCSSPSHGYAMGGSTNGSGGEQNIIEKWSFTSDGDASDVGDLTGTVQGNAGATSTTHGYRTGGHSAFTQSPTTDTNIIDKFAFASDGNATDVGDLTGTWVFGAGANE